MTGRPFSNNLFFFTKEDSFPVFSIAVGMSVLASLFGALIAHLIRHFVTFGLPVGISNRVHG